MNSPQEFFRLTADQQNYNRFKALFLLQLIEAEQRYIKFCDSKYDQERHYSVSFLPEVETNRHKIINSKARVIAELEFIERTYPCPATKLHKLIEYGAGLSEEYFKLLFMVIFTGKLAKRWVPVVKAHFSALEQDNSDTESGFPNRLNNSH